jgi:integrase
MRWEDIDWKRNVIFIRRGKTRLARRFLSMSERIISALQSRKKDRLEGWPFPSDSKPGHLTTVAAAFETAHAKAKLSNEIKLYSARHTFATKMWAANR